MYALSTDSTLLARSMSWENHWEGVVVGVLVAAVLFGIGVWYMKHLQRKRKGSPPPSS